MDAEIAIIGAGPIGLELAVALKHRGVSYLHFEAGQIAQTVFRYPVMTRFFSSPERITIAGVPLHTSDQSKATREDYLAYLRGIVTQFDLDVQTFARVVHIERSVQGQDGQHGETNTNGDGFIVDVDRNGSITRYRVRKIVLAVGDMAVPRLLHIPGEDLELVSHHFDDPHRYFRQKVLIVGGKNSAVEAAIRCHRIGADVSISYRGDRFDPERVKYWLLPEIESLIQSGQIKFYPHTIPVSITRSRVTLTPAPGLIGDPTEIRSDFVLLLTGYSMDATLFKMTGVELIGENRAPKHNTMTMETNIPGVYVAGTAAAGTQKTFKLFIENCHVHVTKIIRSILGQSKHEPPDSLEDQTDPYPIPES